MLIFSTPNKVLLFYVLDPAFWIAGHRHYTFDEVKALFDRAGLRILTIFSAGGLWECLSNLWYCLVTYPIKKIFKLGLPYAPSFIAARADDEYYAAQGRRGYTIFVKARKDCV
jgi:hypothetical protein